LFTVTLLALAWVTLAQAQEQVTEEHKEQVYSYDDAILEVTHIVKTEKSIPHQEHDLLVNIIITRLLKEAPNSDAIQHDLLHALSHECIKEHRRNHARSLVVLAPKE
jgi:hypothetical protein